MSTKPTTSPGIAIPAAAFAIVALAVALAADATAPTWGLAGGMGMAGLLIFQQTKVAKAVIIAFAFAVGACAQSHVAENPQIRARKPGEKALAIYRNPAITNFSHAQPTK
jgi:hypothetical protein